MNFYGKVREQESLRDDGACLLALHDFHHSQVSSPTAPLPILDVVSVRQMQADRCHVARLRPQRLLTLLLELEPQTQYHPTEIAPVHEGDTADRVDMRISVMSFCYPGLVEFQVLDCCLVHMVALVPVQDHYDR